MGGAYNWKTGFLPGIKKALEHMFGNFSDEREKVATMTGTQKKKLKN